MKDRIMQILLYTALLVIFIGVVIGIWIDNTLGCKISLTGLSIIGLDLALFLCWFK